MVLEIEQLTRDQNDCSEWHRLRKGRIGASLAGWVLSSIRRNSYSPSLFKRLLNEDDLSNIPSIEWGRLHESTARELAAKENNIEIVPSGSWVSDQYTFLLASPDGLIAPGFLDTKKCIVHRGRGIIKEISGKEAQGIVEIKSLFKYRNVGVKEAIELAGRNFHLNADGLLNTWHNYYAQIQLAMHFSRSAYCLFVTSTNTENKYEIIYYDENWNCETLEKLATFYHDILIPKLQNN
jgi:hypothetical protein